MPARQISLPGPELPTSDAGPAFTMTEAAVTSMTSDRERAATFSPGGLVQSGDLTHWILVIMNLEYARNITVRKCTS